MPNATPDYKTKYALVRDRGFRDQVGMAILRKAAAIINAAVPTPKPADYDKTLAWAQSAMSEKCERWIDKAVWIIVTNEAITNAGASALDSDVTWMVEVVAVPILVNQNLG